MTTPRRSLPQRRQNETFELNFGESFSVTVGYYNDGTPGEVFISSRRRAGTDFDSICRDGAVLMSLALQHGCPLETIKGALTKTSQGEPMTVIGKVAEAIR